MFPSTYKREFYTILSTDQNIIQILEYVSSQISHQHCQDLGMLQLTLVHLLKANIVLMKYKIDKTL